MGLKERREEAAATLRSALEAWSDGGELPARTLVHDGYAFLLADLELQVSILGKAILPIELSLAELRGKLEAHVGPPPYRTEALSEAFTYPLLVRGPDGQVEEVYVYHGDEGPMLGGDEARRPDWSALVEAFHAALAKVPPVDFSDRAFDSENGAWIYYGVRDGLPFEEWMEGEEPPEWASD